MNKIQRVEQLMHNFRITGSEQDKKDFIMHICAIWELSEKDDDDGRERIDLTSDGNEVTLISFEIKGDDPAWLKYAKERNKES